MTNMRYAFDYAILFDLMMQKVKHSTQEEGVKDNFPNASFFPMLMNSLAQFDQGSKYHQKYSIVIWVDCNCEAILYNLQWTLVILLISILYVSRLQNNQD